MKRLLLTRTKIRAWQSSNFTNKEVNNVNNTKPELVIEKGSSDRTVSRYKTYVKTYKDLIEKKASVSGDNEKDPSVGGTVE